MDKASKAENKITKIAHCYGMSESGLAWFDNAVDPFKDVSRRDVFGYPDNVDIKSCCQPLRQKMVVSRPASVPAGSNWDANIFLDPFFSNQSSYSLMLTGTENIFGRAGQGATPYQRGGVICRSGPANATLNTPTTTDSINPSTDVFGTPGANNKCRVIAYGMEIVDKTAALKQQGSCTTWRICDEPKKTICTLVNTTADVTSLPTAQEYCDLPTPPETASAAADLPGSLTWHAKEGAYINAIMTSSENPPDDRRVCCGLTRDGSGTYYFPQIVSGPGVLNRATSQNMIIPWSTSGAFFQGLSDESVLEVTMMMWVQQFPSATSTLHRLAKKPPGFDPVALKMYGEIARNLPTGCKIKDNGIGNFISGVADILGNIFPAIPQVVKPIVGLFSGGEVKQKYNSSNAENQVLKQRLSQLEGQVARNTYVKNQYKPKPVQRSQSASPRGRSRSRNRSKNGDMKKIIRVTNGKPGTNNNI